MTVESAFFIVAGMKAVRLHGVADIRFEEIDAPGAPPPGHVRVAVKAAGICGSDLHNFRTGQWISRVPATPGHEFSGVVVEAGPGAALSPGTLVVADSRVWCGECPQCRDGAYNLCAHIGFVGEVCEGGFAEEVVLPAHQLLAVPAGTPPEVAALAEPLAVALHGLARLTLPKGAPLLVAGCGAIGGLAAFAASRLHDGPLLVADRNAARASLVAQVTGARIVPLDAAVLAGERLGHALEATGSGAVLTALAGLMAPGGRVALVGIFHGPVSLDANLLVEREITLLGSHAFADELPRAAALAAANAPALSRLVAAGVALEDLPATYQALLAGEVLALKTLARP
ncbi:zinc-dependent alcohol dehydrogenase [Acidocella sp.]|uniref:zinc-dependent alcohol dehydrogenase n=1 Tax=Acidocella sp. TaxID=50710 RepID=UPI003D018759